MTIPSKLSAKSELAGAMRYALGRWAAPIRNYPFAGSDAGGASAPRRSTP